MVHGACSEVPDVADSTKCLAAGSCVYTPPLLLREFKSYTIDNTVLGASDVAVVDMDGDGYLDIVSTAAKTGTVRWHKNAGLGEHRLKYDCGAAQYFTDELCKTPYATEDQSLYGTDPEGNSGHCAKTGNFYGSCLDGPGVSVSMCSDGSFALHRPDGSASHDGGNWFDSSTAPPGLDPAPGSVFSITLGYPELKGPTDTCLAVPQSPKEAEDGVQYYIKQTCEPCPDFIVDMYDASHANPLRGDLGSGKFHEPGLFVMVSVRVGWG